MIKKQTNAFTIIEILVWILIFSMGIVSVFSLIISTLNINENNKNYIIAANLAKEQIELVRNIRDSNFKKVQIYNQINPSFDGDNRVVFELWKCYTIENDFSSSASFPVKVVPQNNCPEKWKFPPDSLSICIDSDNLYTHDCNWNEKIPFFKYIEILPVEYKDGSDVKTIENSFKVVSRVVRNSRWYREFEIVSIFTDFKRF